MSNCDMCEMKFDKYQMVQGFCKICYNWMTDKKKMPKCSNCHIYPVAEKQLCGFTDWCEICDSTLWSTADNDQNKHTDTLTDIQSCDSCEKKYDREKTKNLCKSWYCDECYDLVMA